MNLLKRYWYALRYRKKRVKLCKGVDIGVNVVFEGYNTLASNVNIVNTRLGYASYIGKNSVIENCIIGKYTCIGPRVYSVIGRHPTSRYVSIHPAFFSTQRQAGFSFVSNNKFKELETVDEEGHSIIIGSDVWIGSNVLLMEGVRVGNGVIIGAGTIVNKDIPDYAVVVGCPAKIIRYRFEESQIEKLLRIKWWEKERIWLERHAEEFEDIDFFLRNWEKYV